MKSFSPSETLSARPTALFRCSKNSLAVGELLARANSAEAKSGSSVRALSKCCRESWARSFSARSRPCRNSFRASSDLVVIRTLPPESAGVAPVLALLQAVHAVAASTRIAANAKRTLLERILVASFEIYAGAGSDARAKMALIQDGSGDQKFQIVPMLLDVRWTALDSKIGRWCAVFQNSGYTEHRPADL